MKDNKARKTYSDRNTAMMSCYNYQKLIVHSRSLNGRTEDGVSNRMKSSTHTCPGAKGCKLLRISIKQKTYSLSLISKYLSC